MAKKSESKEKVTKFEGTDKEKLKRLDEALAGIEKKFGKGALMKLGDNEGILNVERFSSGILSVDRATGGGIPKGRIIEVYGPESSGKSTVCLKIAATVQKAGGIVAMVDAEHALDPIWAGKCGVDVDNLYINQCDSGEQGLEVVETIVRSGAIDLIIVDSVAALVPQAEIDGSMGDAVMGAQARLLSKACRKLTSIISKSNCTVIFINQIREKIGVMFGCLHADNMIHLVDGRSFTIKEIVDKKIKGQVWSFNEKTKLFEAKDIIDWHYNGKVNNNKDYIHIETENLDGRGGSAGITVTQDHKVYTEKGWKEAKNITKNDKILTKYRSIINGTLDAFMAGMCCGDINIAVRDTNSACIRLQDNKNLSYVKWKVNKLKDFYNFKQYFNKEKTLTWFSSEFSTELSMLKKVIGNRDPLVMLKNSYSNLAMAIWYMDDGCLAEERKAIISIKRFKNNKKHLDDIVQALGVKGYNVNVNYKDGSITFYKDAMNELFKNICQYIPQCMQYKLTKEYKGKYKEFNLNAKECYKNAFVKIKKIKYASDKQMRQKGKYDITIKDNSNYLAGSVSNGVLVHNSPNTTTGGRALKFYSSIRMEVSKKEAIKVNGEIVGNRTKVKLVKNKVAPPFKEAEYDIMFNEDGVISQTGDLIDIGCELGIVEKSGAWFVYNGSKLGQGRENAKVYLQENQNIFEEIKEKVVDAMQNEIKDKLVDKAEEPEMEEMPEED